MSQTQSPLAYFKYFKFQGKYSDTFEKIFLIGGVLLLLIMIPLAIRSGAHHFEAVIFLIYLSWYIILRLISGIANEELASIIITILISILVSIFAIDKIKTKLPIRSTKQLSPGVGQQSVGQQSVGQQSVGQQRFAPQTINFE